VEELTLYLIEKDEELKRQADFSKKQEKDIQQLKRQFQKLKKTR
jgi:hypothetical protein